MKPVIDNVIGPGVTAAEVLVVFPEISRCSEIAAFTE